MKYLGAKHLIGNHIASFLYEMVEPDMVDAYFEPFCGSLGVFKRVIKYKYKKYIASDIQPDLIQLWKKLQKNELHLPPAFSEKKWKELKHAASPNALKAIAGFGLSFGGVFFSGYIQKYAGNSNRDFYQELKNSLNKIQKLIQKPNIKFYNKSYKDWNPHKMLIYCDPPYKNTTEYKTGDFDHDEFWNIMRKWSKTNYVFISEESAPKDFRVVWKKTKRRTLNAKTRFGKDEKLYVYKYGLVPNNKSKKHRISKNGKTHKNP